MKPLAVDSALRGRFGLGFLGAYLVRSGYVFTAEAKLRMLGLYV